MTPEHRAALERAKARLDRLDLYPRPVRIDGARILVAPWFFRLPLMRRYHGYALVRTTLLQRADAWRTDPGWREQWNHVSSFRGAPGQSTSPDHMAVRGSS